MLDANDYVSRPTGLPPAERCLIPQFWTAPVPIEVAIVAPMGDASTAIRVTANHGRWMVQCPNCLGAQLAAPEDPRFMCVECANAAVGVVWRPVIWPKDHDQLGRLLDLRERHLANWVPGETVKHIEAENALLADARDLRPSAHREPEKWEGHTHRWGKPDTADMRTCRDCELVLPADVIAAAKANA